VNRRSDAVLEASGSQPDLVVESATGVDVSLPVAGPGARAYAFVIDWHIRVVLALAWYVIGALIYNRAWNLAPPVAPSGPWFVGVLLPAAGIYLLYHPLFEIATRGRTPGKRAAGVRVVTQDGAVPSVAAHLIRTVFRLIDSFPGFLYGIGLIVAGLTRNHVRIGDLAAGTLLVYERGHEPVLEHVSTAALGDGLDAAAAELVNELLSRWTTLDVEMRDRLARTLLAKLDRAHPDTIALGEADLHDRLTQLARGTKA
jgi:uncharacterized RDD family membrane protein YckC